MTDRNSLSGALRRRWAVALLVLVVALAAGWAAISAVPTKYRATSIVAFAPRIGVTADGDLVHLLAAKYAAYVGAGSTAARAARALAEDEFEVSDNVAVRLESGTGNIEISVVLPSRQRAAAAANQLADYVVERSETDSLVFADAVAPAEAADAAPTSARAVLTIGAALLAGMVAMVVDVLAAVLGRQRAARRARLREAAVVAAQTERVNAARRAGISPQSVARTEPSRETPMASGTQGTTRETPMVSGTQATTRETTKTRLALPGGSPQTERASHTTASAGTKHISEPTAPAGDAAAAAPPDRP